MDFRAENPDDLKREAVAALRGLGLTEYQSRVFAGLYALQRGTAREVAEESGVPRSRVYDTLNALHERGLVDVQQSTPREYLAVPIDTVVEILNADYQKHGVAAHRAFSRVGWEEKPAAEQEGVWVVTDRDRVSALERQFISEATSRIIFGIASAEVFDEETASALEKVSEDVEIIVESVDSDAVARFELVPGIEVMTPERAWEETPELEGRVGRILLVDDRHVLVSTVVETDQFVGRTNEAAVWTSGGGAGDGLVSVLKRLMLDRVDDRVHRGSKEPSEGEKTNEVETDDV